MYNMYIIYWLLMMQICFVFASIFPAYVPCPKSTNVSQKKDTRRFYLSTFKTGNDSFLERKFQLEGQGFNSSDNRDVGLQGIGIAGKDLRFWKKRFFYHPYSSLQFVRNAIRQELALGYDPSNAYSMHLDYDTVLTGTSMQRLWEKFDCARNGKPILIAGETGCLAGLGCTEKQLKKYYDPIGPYRAAFVNAGGIMGSLPALEIMFAHIVDNEKSYRKLTWRLKWFCDQNALAHWRANNTHLIEIDHQQEVFATIPFQTPNHNLKRKNDGVCRNETGEVHHTCVEIFPPKHAFEIDMNSCSVHRNNAAIIKANPIFSSYLDEFAPDPVCFHGLGGLPSKAIYKELSNLVYRCRSKQVSRGQILIQ